MILAISGIGLLLIVGYFCFSFNEVVTEKMYVLKPGKETFYLKEQEAHYEVRYLKDSSVENLTIPKSNVEILNSWDEASYLNIKQTEYLFKSNPAPEYTIYWSGGGENLDNLQCFEVGSSESTQDVTTNDFINQLTQLIDDRINVDLSNSEY